MNVDEAIAKWKQLREHYCMPAFPQTMVDILAAEVERLRAELELSKANAESLKKALHEVQNAAIRLGDQVDNAKAELAAAKAASVVPVQVIDCYSFGDDVEVVCKCGDDADRLSGWIRDRMKERGEG